MAKTIQQRFLEFHHSNPHVFAAFVEAARALRRQGREHYGAKAIYEYMRYHMALPTAGEEWRLNNSYTSRYARLLLESYPGEFDQFLEVRRLKAE